MTRFNSKWNSPPVPEVQRDLLDGAEDLEPLPEVGPGGALLDLAHVDDPALLDLALLLLLQLARVLLAPLTVAGEALAVVRPGNQRRQQILEQKSRKGL